ncbi:MAG: thioesterase family protein [Pseudomonadota bacterium]|nr:thioesterase family protein [Pseudomonadota bacterium]
MVKAVFSQLITVQPEQIDGLGHVNNVVYLQWVEQVAWQHSQALGLDLAAYQRLDAAMVAREHHLTYLAACFALEVIELRTWLAERDAVNLYRHYQFVRVSDERVVFEGSTRWVCIRLSTGRPMRMPTEFCQAYQVV